ncbi:MAG: class I SAM-dependent methyltransferase [Peptostreptococcus sp.]|uniref:tRNA (adenine(22)-N(1))-methyltransferase n=1 Tax=Peptostreptococcus sp. TaxID=1262 RepID=UPI002FC9F41F
MKLTKRLEKIASLVSDNVKVADIGTDHGYIPVYLLKEDKIKSAILADINKGPLNNAREEIKKMGLENLTDLRLGSGVSVLKTNEVDEIIIAGMGGVLISEIIEDGLDVCKSCDKLILQPMQAPEELRKYLLNNNFEIIDEHMVNEDFRIYEIIEARYNPKFKNNPEEIYLELPKQLIDRKEPLMKIIILKKIKECNSILEKIGNSNGKSVEERISYLNSRKNKLETLIREMEE